MKRMNNKSTLSIQIKIMLFILMFYGLFMGLFFFYKFTYAGVHHDFHVRRCAFRLTVVSKCLQKLLNKLSGAYEFITGVVAFVWLSLNIQLSVQCFVYFCSSFQPFFYWRWYCLSFDLLLLITTLVSSNFLMLIDISVLFVLCYSILLTL